MIWVRRIKNKDRVITKYPCGEGEHVATLTKHYNKVVVEPYE